MKSGALEILEREVNGELCFFARIVYEREDGARVVLPITSGTGVYGTFRALGMAEIMGRAALEKWRADHGKDTDWTTPRRRTDSAQT